MILLVMILLLTTACDTTSSNTAPSPPESPTPEHNSINVANNTTLRWTCSDEDNDELTYSVYLGKDELELIASDIEESVFTPEALDYSTEYIWKVIASDGEETTKSQLWTFRTVTEDYPPVSPQNPTPSNEEDDVDVNLTFGWYCYDINGDDLTFDLKLGTTTDLPIVATNLDHYQFSIDNLAYHTVYYWQVIAKSTDNVTEGPVWSFETRYYNYPPDKAYDPLPNNGTTDVSTHTQLSWRCNDTEDDPLSYDIYLGTDNNPLLAEQGYDQTTYTPETLEAYTDYYWRIDAWDGSNYSHGAIWHFTTGDQNTAPEIPYSPWPSDGATGEAVQAMLRWTCNDPDGDNLVYKIYFSTNPELSENHVIAIGIDDETWGLGTLNYNTTYYWKVKAHDGDLESISPTWSFTTETNR